MEAWSLCRCCVVVSPPSRGIRKIRVDCRGFLQTAAQAKNIIIDGAIRCANNILEHAEILIGRYMIRIDLGIETTMDPVLSRNDVEKTNAHPQLTLRNTNTPTHLPEGGNAIDSCCSQHISAESGVKKVSIDDGTKCDTDTG